MYVVVYYKKNYTTPHFGVWYLFGTNHLTQKNENILHCLAGKKHQQNPWSTQPPTGPQPRKHTMAVGKEWGAAPAFGSHAAARLQGGWCWATTAQGRSQLCNGTVSTLKSPKIPLGTSAGAHRWLMYFYPSKLFWHRMKSTPLQMLRLVTQIAIFKCQNIRG